jgi:Flp pilus assembly protein TadG
MSRALRWPSAGAWPGRGDGGSIALETAVLAISVTLILGAFLTVVGRSNVADGQVDGAAKAAARAASLTRDQAAAQDAGQRAAAAELDEAGVPCRSWALSVDASGLSRPAGQAATVTATVTCTVSFGDLLVPGVPGARTLKATYSSVVDQFRARP